VHAEDGLRIFLALSIALSANPCIVPEYPNQETGEGETPLKLACQADRRRGRAPGFYLRHLRDLFNAIDADLTAPPPGMATPPHA
jgi:hypothetical protein